MPSDIPLVPATAAPDALPRLGAALAAVAPTLNQAVRSTWAEALSEHLVAAHITTPRRLAAFVGQCALESAGFHALEESLGYSALRLCQVWPARFPTLAAAQPFAFQPEALANQVYANRMGNGGAASGDGWRFRGRGLIQLTGRSAYQRFAASCGQSLDAAVAAASTPAGAAQTAVWFWTVNGLNALADAWALDRITLRINCATQAEPERAALCNTALHALGG